MKTRDSKKNAEHNRENSENKSPEMDNENLPGYPHYPPSEDIMNSTEEKLGLDVENAEAPLVKNQKENTDINVTDDLELQEGTSADVTNEDLRNLGDDELSMDLGDDEDLKHRLFPLDMEGKDLTIPGAELDDVQEEIGNEDEENNFYSQADN